MSRTRRSTTVAADLRDAAPGARAAVTDAAVEALVARGRAAEVDASYAVLAKSPLDRPMRWGDLESFRRAAGAS